MSDPSLGLVFVINGSVALSRVECYGGEMYNLTLFNQRTQRLAPARTLTDAYGLQAVQTIGVDALAAMAAQKNITTEILMHGRVIRVHVPIAAPHTRASPGLADAVPSVRVVDFYFGIPLWIKASTWLNHSFAHVWSPDCGYLEALEQFRAALGKGGPLAQWHLLTPNPLFQQEKRALALMHDAHATAAADAALASILLHPLLSYADFPLHGGALAVVRDRSHGTIGAEWCAVHRAIADVAAVDWIALEMVSQDLQWALDGFLHANDTNSTRFLAAQAALQQHVPWPDEYLVLIEQARLVGRKQMVALDIPLWYDVFRYGESPLGDAVRSLAWVDALPISAQQSHWRGVLMGGAAHFQMPAFTAAFAQFQLRAPNATMLFVEMAQEPPCTARDSRHHALVWVPVLAGVCGALALCGALLWCYRARLSSLLLSTRAQHSTHLQHQLLAE